MGRLGACSAIGGVFLRIEMVLDRLEFAAMTPVLCIPFYEIRGLCMCSILSFKFTSAQYYAWWINQSHKCAMDTHGTGEHDRKEEELIV